MGKVTLVTSNRSGTAEAATGLRTIVHAEPVPGPDPFFTTALSAAKLPILIKVTV